MSDLLNKASLVMVPSGYKEDTVYSVVPSDGSGDLSFTRASNGTRINSAGLVEVAPWNLLEQSESFSTSPWANTNVTLTSGQIDPNGGTTAFRAQFSGVSYLLQNLTALNGTNSVYAKAYGSTAKIRLCDPNGSFSTQYNLTTEWQRITTSGNALAGFSIDSYIDGGWTSQDIVMAFAQTNIGSTAKPYFPTTDRLNVPRLTYQNGSGGCPSLLLEKQSTNQLSYSEQIQNADWNVIGGDLVVTGNAVISPDGTQNAGAITLANSANRYFVHSIIGLTGGVAYTYSVYMKSASGNLLINMGGVNGLVGVMKTVTTEWQRFTYTFTPSTSYGEYFGFDNRAASASTSGTLYFWGAQVEASSYPTSYIPTTSSSATRVADACYKTGISSLIGQTTGSVFIDFELFTFDGYEGVVEITGSQRLLIWRNGTSLILFTDFGAGYIDTTFAIGRHKACFTYTSSYIKFFVDGVKIGQIASTGLTGGFNKLDFENSQGGVQIQRKLINECVVSKSEFTEAEAIALTTI